VLLLQRKNRQLQHRRSLPHGYFELRLGEECLLGRDGAQTFSIARIDINGGPDAESFAAAATQLLRSSDILGTYGPDAYEILFPRTTPADAERALDPLLRKLNELGAAPHAAFAHFPVDGRTAYALIERACARLRPAPVGSAPPGVIVRDRRMREVYRLAEKAAGRDINVLILGETGVGKEILAQTIHRASKRAERPFLSLNCGGVSETLRESELFGYERGAFTDAKVAKPGLLEMAEGGTVFLDEIGEMSPSIQAMLLRAIDTKQIMRVGGVRPKAIDVRFVAATNRDLVEEIREKRFRSDLYYRLNQISLEIPPLRERRLEIRPLAEAFLAELAGGAAGAPRLSDEAVQLLESHAWDGNIRELRNVINRALVLCDGDTIEPEHLPLETLQRELARGFHLDVGLNLLRAYNDWHIDEWCGTYPGRFIPLSIPPIWDPQLMADEVHRVAKKGCHAVTFWGFTDAHSWIDAQFGADDPLLFDEQYAAKPAFFGVLDAFRRR